MQIEVIDSLEAIKQLKNKWAELYQKAGPGLFSHHTWVYENYHYFDSEILLLAVYGEKKCLIGIFPFSIDTFRIKWFKYKALVHGGSSVTDYSQFIIDPDSNSRLMVKRVLAKLIELQPGNWDFFKIDNLSDNDDNANLFKNLMLKALYAGTTATEITPIIKYNHGYQEAKKIANVKRRFKKISQDSNVIHKSGTEITSKLLREFSELHQESYPDSGFDKDRAQSFYKALTCDDEINDQIYLSYIHHDNKIIAAHFGFMDAEKFYYYVPTYCEKYSTYGPGQYLLLELISLAETEQRVEFDFLRGSEEYKFSWTNKINTNYTVLGVLNESSRFKKLLVNLWLVTKEIPFFKHTTES